MDEKKHFVSVITVVRNDRDGLHKTAESIYSQSFNNFEWIVVDGASEDGTLQFIKQQQRIDMWISEEDQGIYDAMNKGVKIASGKYTVFMNAGDIFTDNTALQCVFDKLCQLDDLNTILYGGAQLEFSNGREWYRSPKDEQYIWHGLPANHQATFYPTRWLLNHPYDLSYRICGDYYVAVRAYQSHLQVVYLNKPIVRFRVGDTSYRHPLSLLQEAYSIQRDVLHLGITKRIFSFVRRLLAINMTIAISNLPFRPSDNN